MAPKAPRTAPTARAAASPLTCAVFLPRGYGPGLYPDGMELWFTRQPGAAR